MGYITYDNSTQVGSDGVEFSTKLSAFLKIFSLFGFLLLLGGFLLVRKFFIANTINQVSITNNFGKTELKIPYKNTLYENFGFVQDPKITIPLKTLNGYHETIFLLDSGAVVTTMPLQAAHDTGVDLAKAKRITLQGFSGVPTFAYLDRVTIKLGDREYELPATFTDSNATTYILGRKGLFDDYTIQFDHEQRAVVISGRQKK